MRLGAINRYPVKSMQGEPLERGELDLDGLRGDRTWGVVDNETGKVWSAKRRGELLEASAVTTPDGPRITLPDGTVIDPGDGDRDAKLSAWLDADVTLQPASNERDKVYEANLELDPDAPVFDVPMNPGHFLDLSPVHLVTTASLRAGAEAHPSGDWTPHRFRPTLLVETDDDEPASFLENDWVGKTISVGDVVLEVVLPTVRCVMTTRVQPPKGIERDLDIFRSLRRVNQQNLGVYANVTRAGTVSVGDPVEVR